VFDGNIYITTRRKQIFVHEIDMKEYVRAKFSFKNVGHIGMGDTNMYSGNKTMMVGMSSSCSG
jgi:hypothetical protein